MKNLNHSEYSASAPAEKGSKLRALVAALGITASALGIAGTANAADSKKPSAAVTAPTDKVAKPVANAITSPTAVVTAPTAMQETLPVNDELAKEVLREILKTTPLYQEAGKKIAAKDLQFFEEMRDQAAPIVEAQLKGLKKSDSERVAQWLKDSITAPNIRAQSTRIDVYGENLESSRAGIIKASKGQCKDGNPPECTEVLANYVQEYVQRTAKLEGVGEKLYAALKASGLIGRGIKTLSPYDRLLSVARAVGSLPVKEREAILGTMTTTPNNFKDALKGAHDKGYAEAATMAVTNTTNNTTNIKNVTVAAPAAYGPWSAFADVAVNGQDKQGGDNDVRHGHMGSISVGGRFVALDKKHIGIAGEAGVQGLTDTVTAQGPALSKKGKTANVVTPFVGAALQSTVYQKGNFSLQPRVRGDVGYSLANGPMLQGLAELVTYYRQLGVSLGFGVQSQKVDQKLGQDWYGNDIQTSTPAVTPVGKIGVEIKF